MPAATAHRIAGLFEACRQQNRAAFVAYLTAGDPSPDLTPELVLALEEGGADLIELGVPFSDPIADGPVIQRASHRALSAGTTLSGILANVRAIRRTSQIPILLFSYLNPLLRFGFDKLAAAAADAGVDGVLLTDLSVEEAPEPVRQLRFAGLDTIFLAAPTSSLRRLELVAQHSSGFIYLVSRSGVTGVRENVSDAVRPLIERMRCLTPLPLAVGFGVSTPEQVRAVGELADGVVVGSALVKFIEEHARTHNLPALFASFTQQLAGPLLDSNLRRAENRGLIGA